MRDNGLPRVILLSLSVALLLAIVLWSFSRQDDVLDIVEESAPVLELDLPILSDAEFDWIAARIYQNEAMGQSAYLTFWGEGEDFPSFGIGHFIWFPGGVDAPFDEMFPDMVSFVRQASRYKFPVPAWMDKLAPFDAPWTDKQQFDEVWSSTEMTGLRDWLEATSQQQARFIVATFEKRWRELSLPAEQKQGMTAVLQELAESAEGLFAIIDYYNFKGLGVNPRERYEGQGWGLIQVLEAMEQLNKDEQPNADLLDQFRRAAADRLRLRVELSPPERNETRWLEGWLKRLDGYNEQLDK